jgi:hypothetical protein
VFARAGNGCFDVVDFELEAVPPSGLRQGSIRHRLPAPGRTEHEAEVVAGEHREARRWVHLFMEVELSAVEVDCGVNVVDDVADAYFGRAVSSRWCTCRTYAFRSDTSTFHMLRGRSCV